MAEKVFTFVSNRRNKKLRLRSHCKRSKDKVEGGEAIATFHPTGNREGDYGIFTTTDPAVAEQIRKHKFYGDSWTDVESGKGIVTEIKDGVLPATEKTYNINKGVVSTVSPEERAKVEKEIETKVKAELEEKVNSEVLPKSIRYGELRGKILNSNGSYKANADPEDIKEFEELRKEFETK